MRALAVSVSIHSEQFPFLTIANNLQTVSLGCAPTPSQYFALLTSSLMSFCCLSPGAAPTGVWGMGL